MSKDYSHIKPGMYVSLGGIEVDSELELSIIDAFVNAGAIKDEGRDESFNSVIRFDYRYFGWVGDTGTYFCDNTEFFNEQVSVDFILNGPKTSSEALQDTLEEKATKVLVKGENDLESNTERLKLIGKIAYTKQYPNDGAVIDAWDAETACYYIVLPWQDKDSGIYIAPEDIGWVEEYQEYVKKQATTKTETGASVNISVLVSVQGNNYQLTRDQAYKLWEDLTEIFEEKLV